MSVFRWAGCMCGTIVCILLTPSICCWRYQVAALTSGGCYCGNRQHGLVASECFNTSKSGETKDIRGESERQRWGRLLPFLFSFNAQPLLLYCFRFMSWARSCWWHKPLCYYFLLKATSFTLSKTFQIYMCVNWELTCACEHHSPWSLFCVCPVLDTLNLFFSVPRLPVGGH